MIATVLLGVCLAVAGPEGPPNPEGSRGGDSQRRQAPEDPAGTMAGRPEQSGPAPTSGPEDVTARGLLGLVRYRDEWLKPDAVAARVLADADQAGTLDEYHARRRRTPETPMAQTELADWCEHRGLKAEAIAHLTAVTLLAPNQSTAWKRLGYRPIHGKWMSDEQYAAQKAADDEQKAADRYWESHLAALAKRLDGTDPERESVERELAGVTSPRAVPAIWRTFGTGKSARLGLAIRMLGQIDSPESSRRLTTLINTNRREEAIEDAERESRLLGLFMPWLRESAEELSAERQASACEQALTILRRRDQRDFLDGLIDSLQEPVRIEMQRGADRFSGTLHVESETLNYRRTYHVLARVYAPGVRRGKSVAGHDINRDYQAALNYQASVDRKNRKVRYALSELTGQVIDDPDPVSTREALREWWANEQGYPYTRRPPLRKRTVNHVASVVLFWSGHGNGHSCFAAGTPVRTLLGLRPIESIQVGDQVLAQDVTSGALSFEPVVALHHNSPKPTLRIDLGDEAFVATPIHRFWKVGQGWAMARELKPGDTIRRLAGTALVVSVSEEKVQPVFNLDVAERRSFFVGASGALVHDNSLVDPVLHPFDAPHPTASSAVGAR
jgi:ribosomal protein S11